jgi:hypothetical protein
MHSNKHYETKSLVFQEKHFEMLSQLLNSCASVHSGGWCPHKRHCTQKVKEFINNLSTVVNCNMLKLILITFGKMSFIFTVISLYLPHPVCTCKISALQGVTIFHC